MLLRTLSMDDIAREVYRDMRHPFTWLLLYRDGEGFRYELFHEPFIADVLNDYDQQRVQIIDALDRIGAALQIDPHALLVNSRYTDLGIAGNTTAKKLAERLQALYNKRAGNA